MVTDYSKFRVDIVFTPKPWQAYKQAWWHSKDALR